MVVRGKCRKEEGRTEAGKAMQETQGSTTQCAKGEANKPRSRVHLRLIQGQKWPALPLRLVKPSKEAGRKAAAGKVFAQNWKLDDMHIHASYFNICFTAFAALSLPRDFSLSLSLSIVIFFFFDAATLWVAILFPTENRTRILEISKTFLSL